MNQARTKARELFEALGKGLFDKSTDELGRIVHRANPERCVDMILLYAEAVRREEREIAAKDAARHYAACAQLAGLVRDVAAYARRELGS